MSIVVQTPTNGLKNSIEFYEKLKFHKLSDKNPTLFSDGKIMLEINPDRYARAGVKLYSTNWETTVKQLEKITTVIEIENGYLLYDLSGTFIYLIESLSPPSFDLSQIQNSILGNQAGLSLETISIEKSMKIWEFLEFSVNMGSPEDGWVSLVNKDNFGISLMKPNTCPHLFFNPSLTYFNGSDNPKVIKQIREIGIQISEEITYFNPGNEAENIIIRDPGGLGFFIFND